MTNPTFDELLDAIEGLSDIEQAELVDLVSRRLSAGGRQRVISEVNLLDAECGQ